MRTSPVEPAVAIALPEGANATAATRGRCPLSVCRTARVWMSQRLTAYDRPLMLASVRPSGEKASVWTGCVSASRKISMTGSLLLLPLDEVLAILQQVQLGQLL